MKSETKMASVIVLVGFICAAIALQFNVPKMVAAYENDTQKAEIVVEQAEDNM